MTPLTVADIVAFLATDPTEDEARTAYQALAEVIPEPFARDMWWEARLIELGAVRPVRQAVAA